MTSGFVKRIATVLIGVLILVGAAWAQSTTEGAIAGTVYDPMGAVVANATVTVRNLGTNAEQKVTADSSGYFRVLHLQPATYEITVAATGFTSYKATNLTVNIGSVSEVSPHLKTAGTAETIEVQAELPQVNTVSADYSPVVNQVAIQNLPINGGRWSNFVVLTPTVVHNADGFGLVSFKGMSVLQNNNTVDGADNNQAFFAEERGRTRAGYSTPKTAIQEFQVNSSNYSAEYGRAVGGVMNTVTKSGTNSLHGEAYFYDRDNELGAMNPFTTLTDTTAPFAVHPYKPTDVRKMTGGSVGGPIIKDKLFFFLAFDFFDRNFPGTAIAQNPKTVFATPSCSAPNSSSPCSATSTIGTLSTRLYGANTLATNAQALAQYNADMSDLVSTLGPTPRSGRQFIWLPKIDWQINDRNRFSLVVNRMRWASPSGIQTQATNNYGVRSFGDDYVKDTWGVAKLSTTISNSVVNEFRTQYGRDFEFQNPQQPTTYEQANLVSSKLFPSYTNPLGLPPQVTLISTSTGWTLGVASFLTRPKYPDETRQQYADTVTFTHGKHTVKAGFDFTHVFDDTANLRYQFGGYSESSLLNYFTDLHKALGCTWTDKSVTPNVTRNVPCYSSFQQAFGPLGFHFATNDYAFFVQDDWKLLPRLSLTLGLRWDYEQLPSAILPNTAVPQTSKLPSDTNNYGPRIGFAFDVFGDGKTSLRGGYGLVYGRVINSTIYSALTSTGNPGGQLSYSFSSTSASTYKCAPNFPQVLTAAQLAATLQANPSCNAGSASTYFDSNFKLPQSHQVDLVFEHEMPWNTVVRMSYIGAFGRHLPSFVDTNIARSTQNITYTVCGVNGPGATDVTSCGFPQRGQPIQTPTLTLPLYTKRLDTTQGALTDIISTTNSSYHALVFEANHRMSRHVQFNTNVTWSHAIDYGQNSTTFTTTNALFDPYNIAMEKGNSDTNIPLRFVFNAIVEAPWKINNRVARALVNGWQFAPMYQWQNGLSYSARTTGNAPGGLSGGMNGSNGDYRVIGTRNQFHYPNTSVVDARLSKIFSVTERYKVEFSADLFNLMNHVNATKVTDLGYYVGTNTVNGVANTPTLTYNTGAFGTVSNANSNFAYSQRQIQLGVRFTY